MCGVKNVTGSQTHNGLKSSDKNCRLKSTKIPGNLISESNVAWENSRPVDLRYVQGY